MASWSGPVWGALSSALGQCTFVTHLVDAFGWRYVGAVFVEYGINQGGGAVLIGAGMRFYAFDTLGVSTAEYGRMIGFRKIPWMLKAIFGIASDTMPISGLRRTPYLCIAAILGVASCSVLAALSLMSASLAAWLWLCTALNVALADVIIDGTIAERCKAVPEQAARLQSFAWASLAIVAAVSSIAGGYLVEYLSPRVPFAIAATCALCLLAPAGLGWLGETRRRVGRVSPGSCWPRGWAPECLCAEMLADPTRRRVLAAALLVGVYSVTVGVLQINMGSSGAVNVGVIVANFALCGVLYVCLRPVDEALARALVYRFLHGATTPSASIVFAWARDPIGDDDRCLSANACAELGRPYGAARDDDAPPPCGWAHAAGMPCIPAHLFAWENVAGCVALLAGTALYNTVFTSWRYRSIMALAQLTVALVGLIDLVFITRLNRAIGVPDLVIYLIGDEVAIAIAGRLLTMPFYIFAAELCPVKVEASMFALIMGLNNSGSSAGNYLGSAVLDLLGTKEPHYRHADVYIVIRAAMRILQIPLILFLVPRGSPADTASDIGASRDMAGDGEEPTARLRSDDYAGVITSEIDAHACSKAAANGNRGTELLPVTEASTAKAPA